jgi:hypothetical protein
MYETEIKIEITATQLEELKRVFQARGFADKGIAPQGDYYTKAVESKHGDPKAFDIERYRSEGGKFFFTKKAWEVENGIAIRKEEERDVTKQEYETAVAENPEALKIVKDRHWFNASFEGREISLSIDSVKFDHSPTLRYFMEPEILVEDRARVPETKDFLRRFAGSLLGIDPSEIVEAPGMFAMAFKKL